MKNKNLPKNLNIELKYTKKYTKNMYKICINIQKKYVYKLK